MPSRKRAVKVRRAAVSISSSDTRPCCNASTSFSLRGFQRVRLAPGESKTVEFRLSARDFMLVDEDGNRRLEPGRFRLAVGGSQPDAVGTSRLGQAPLAAEIVFA